MMTEEPEKYQRMLQNLIFKAQQVGTDLECYFISYFGIYFLIDSPIYYSDLGVHFQFVIYWLDLVYTILVVWTI